jgi:aryl carrier-like protein
MEAFVCGEVRRVIGLSASTAVDPGAEWTMLGIDSLMAVELKNRLEAASGLAIGIADLLQAGCARELSRRLLDRVRADQQPRGLTLVATGAGMTEEGEF